MEKNPRKSKALIITFVLVLGLLIGGYYVFTSDTLFGVENSIGKKFSPFLITPKEKDLGVIETPEGQEEGIGEEGTETPPTDTTPPVGTGVGGTGNVGTGIVGDGINIPPSGNKLTPPSGGSTPIITKPFIPQCRDGADNDGDTLIDDKDPGCHTDGDATNTKSYDRERFVEFNLVPECSDGIDNDKDRLADDKDPGCHTDGNAKNTATYTPSYPYEYNINSSGSTSSSTSGQCTQDDIPLTFTAEEQRQLDELTKQFYRLAPLLKSADDVLAEEKARQSYIDLVDNAETLTRECYEQTYNDKYLANSDLVVTDGYPEIPLVYIHTQEQKVPGRAKPLTITLEIGRFWDDNNNAVEGRFGKKIMIIPYASRSGLDMGRVERRPNPYQITPVYINNSYNRIFKTVKDSGGNDVTVYPWAAWEDLLGIW